MPSCFQVVPDPAASSRWETQSLVVAQPLHPSSVEISAWHSTLIRSSRGLVRRSAMIGARNSARTAIAPLPVSTFQCLADVKGVAHIYAEAAGDREHGDCGIEVDVQLGSAVLLQAVDEIADGCGDPVFYPPFRSGGHEGGLHQGPVAPVFTTVHVEHAATQPGGPGVVVVGSGPKGHLVSKYSITGREVEDGVMRAIRMGKAGEGRGSVETHEGVDGALVHGTALAKPVKHGVGIVGVPPVGSSTTAPQVKQLTNPLPIQLAAEAHGRPPSFGRPVSEQSGRDPCNNAGESLIERGIRHRQATRPLLCCGLIRTRETGPRLRSLRGLCAARGGAANPTP